MSFPPLERTRDLPVLPDTDLLAGLQQTEAPEHRRQLAVSIKEVGAIVLASRPSVSFCTADTTVSSAAFASVAGISQTLFAPLNGDAAIVGVLAVEELTAGRLQVQITAAGVVIWGPWPVQSQAALLLEPSPQLGKWLIPIGGPAILPVVGSSTYTLDVQVAAPAGSYKVLAGTGKVSYLSATPWPSLNL